MRTMRLWFVCCIVLIAGCDTAGRGFGDAKPVKSSMGGSHFTIRIADNVAEVIRTSPEWNPRFSTTAVKAGMAVQAQRPDCRAAWVEGDPALMRVGLSCNGKEAPNMVTRSRLTCRVVHDPYTLDIIRCRDT